MKIPATGSFLKLSAMTFLVVLAFIPANAGGLPAGSAEGLLSYDGNAIEMSFAAAFVDQKDEKKPVILVIADRKLPVERWTSEFDMMRDDSKWSGFAVWLDSKGEVFRSDVHIKGKQTSVFGVWDWKFDNATGKELVGTVRSKKGETEITDVSFHATRS